MATLLLRCARWPPPAAAGRASRRLWPALQGSLTVALPLPPCVGTARVVGGFRPAASVAAAPSHSRSTATPGAGAAAADHDPRERIVVVGTGWAALRFLRDIDAARYAVTVVSPRDHMLFTPLLTSTCTGTIEHRSAIEPVRQLVADRGFGFVQASAVGVRLRGDGGQGGGAGAAAGGDAETLGGLGGGGAVADRHGTGDASGSGGGGSGGDDGGTTATVSPAAAAPHTLQCRVTGGLSGLPRDLAPTVAAVPEFDVPFDALVMAVGAVPDTFGLPGVTEHAFFLKEVADARRIRNRLQDLFAAASLPHTTPAERRRLLTFVVVGGGPTGVEFAAELSDFLSDDVTRNYRGLADAVSVLLYEAGNSLLSSFEAGLAAYATRRLRRGRVDVRLAARVQAVGDGWVRVAEGSATDGGGGHVTVPCGMVVWSTGVGRRDIIKALGAAGWPLGARGGGLAVNDKFQVLLSDTVLSGTAPSGGSGGSGAEAVAGRAAGAGVAGTSSPSVPSPSAGPGLPVFALGDCATITAPGVAPLPPLAQVAEQSGAALAARLNTATPAGVGGGWAGTSAWAPFAFHNKGMLAYLGGRTGVSSVAVPVKGTIDLAGAAAWATWRLAYLSKLSSWRNRVQVPLDWVKTALLGRDVSRF